MSEETIHGDDVFDELMKDEDIGAITYGVREIEIGGVTRRQAFETSDPAEIDAGATAEMRAARERQRHFIYKTSGGTTHILADVPSEKPAVDRQEAQKQARRVLNHYSKKCAAGELSPDEWRSHVETTLRNEAIYRATRPGDKRSESEILKEAAQDGTMHRKLKILEGLFERLKSGKLTFDSRDFAAGLGSLAKRD